MGFGPFFCIWSVSKESRINELIAPLVQDLGYEFVGIHYQPGSGNGLIRVYIDEPNNGIALEDCEKVSREVEALLDVEDPISGQYTLEISSPGVDRPLFTLAHFAQFEGHEANLTLSKPLAGRRRWKGILCGVDGEQILMKSEGEEVAIEWSHVVKAKLVPDYDLLLAQGGH